MRTQGDPGRLPRPRNTLAFPPPKQSPTPLPAKRSSLSDGQPAIKDFFLDESSSWEDPWEGLFDEEVSPPRRRWPAVIAFSITGIVVMLIGVGAAGRIREQSEANARPSERTLEATQEQSAPPKPHSEDAVRRVDAIVDTKKPQLPPVSESQAATLAAHPTEPNAGREPPPQAVAKATGSAPAVEQRPNPITATPPRNLAAPSPDKPTAAAKAVVSRRSHKPRSADTSSRARPTQAEPGIPVDEIYTNDRGELVDAQGNALAAKKEPAQIPEHDVEAEP